MPEVNKKPAMTVQAETETENQAETIQTQYAYELNILHSMIFNVTNNASQSDRLLKTLVEYRLNQTPMNVRLLKTASSWFAKGGDFESKKSIMTKAKNIAEAIEAGKSGDITINNFNNPEIKIASVLTYIKKQAEAIIPEKEAYENGAMLDPRYANLSYIEAKNSLPRDVFDDIIKIGEKSLLTEKATENKSKLMEEIVSRIKTWNEIFKTEKLRLEKC